MAFLAPHLLLWVQNAVGGHSGSQRLKYLFVGRNILVALKLLVISENHILFNPNDSMHACMNSVHAHTH